MLSWIRRYQKYIYIAVTAIIIISFTFFGTYQAFNSVKPHEDPVAFTAVDGRSVKQSDVDRLAMFLSSDAEEKVLFGGVWGPNFLNDGVIRQDFLKTGLAQILIEAYSDQIGPDLSKKLQREKAFATYVHPNASFISAGQVWKAMVPELHESFRNLRSQTEAASPEAVDARVQLFLAERQFPAPALKHVIKYQEQQFGWIPPDAQLDAKDLSLFGYHMVDDWFGPTFTRLVSQFIINTAKIATERGYKVSKEEALADLIGQSKKSFNEVQKLSSQGVGNAQEYMQEQIRRMQLDRSQIVDLWRQVLLFRRLFHDFGHSVFIDTLPFEQYHQHAKEYVGIDFYSLPEPLRFSDFRTLQKFELYLDGVANRTPEQKKSLILPTQFLSAEKVEQKHPELVYVPYVLEVTTVDQHVLASEVPLTKAWAWELDEGNWKAVVEKFPELANKPASTRAERSSALDSLSRKTRGQVDAFARKQIVKSDPTTIEKQLNNGMREEKRVSLRKKGGTLPFHGFEANPQAREQLWELLSQAPEKNMTSPTAKQRQAQEKLNQFSPDDRFVYRFVVLKRSPNKEIMTFAEADEDGTLDELVVEKLGSHYETVREEEPGKYRKGDGKWKELREVRDSVASHYFRDILRAIQRATGKQETMTEDETSAYRFQVHLQEAKKNLMQDPSYASEQETKGVENQWRLEKKEKQINRSTPSDPLNWQNVFALQDEEWSDIHQPRSGHGHFYQIRERGVTEPDLPVWERTWKAYQNLSNDAQQTLMRNLLERMQGKKALLAHSRRSSLEDDR